jgi:hypothetical protein
MIVAFDKACEGLGEMVATLCTFPDSPERRAFAIAAAGALLQLAEALTEIGGLGAGEPLRERVEAALRQRDFRAENGPDLHT